MGNVSKHKDRVWQTQSAFYEIKNIFCNRPMSVEVRYRVRECCIKPALHMVVNHGQLVNEQQKQQIPWIIWNEVWQKNDKNSLGSENG